jgi:pimeloyl-ACP methyl ester carboxylesterase
MPRISAGNVALNYVEFGKGDNIVVYIHGNLGCLDWMNLVWPRLPADIHVFAFDWRGCGDSDKPSPTADYSNYSITQHAVDMIAAIRKLGIKKCCLANHSTGGIICTRMLLMEPAMFGKVFCLDPVAPVSVFFDEKGIGLFRSMKENYEFAYSIMAGTSPSLFTPESMQTGQVPQFRDTATQEQKDLFKLIVDKTRVLSDGIWFGTPINLTKEYQTGELKKKQKNINHQHLILWGEKDVWIPRGDLEEMAREMPNCELKILPDIGHCMNLENPAGLAQMFAEYFMSNN